MLTTDIKIQPSNIFGSLVLLATASSVVIDLTLPLPLAAKLLLIALSTSYGFYIFHQDCLMKGYNSISSLYLNKNGWQLKTLHGVTPARICGDSTLSAFVSVLRFKTAESDRKRSCVIFRDAVSPDAYRRLLVVLRTGAGVTAQ